ncbi:MAG TPA: hypothetical protein VFE33_20835 [Thermoanaerobaculia bacterium]|nr:hypothetical protein [Thermoanaerobaculia bacterium]
MAERKIEEVSVYRTEAGKIAIAQNVDTEDPHGPDVVLLAPEQIDILIQWLEEAKKEIGA